MGLVLVLSVVLAISLRRSVRTVFERAYHALEAEMARRKGAQEALAQQAQELARSNQELEQFASVSSHDLQEPLRKIETFGDLLKNRSAGALDDQGRDYLERIQDAAGRMRDLINDLLTFSRVSSQTQPFVPVDLDHLTREVLSDLEVVIDQSGGRVKIGGLPTIEADRTQMRQLMQNLVGNGLKFHRPGEPPLVRINGRILNGQAHNGSQGRLADHSPLPGLCEITVEDNGIGFDEKYLDRIFTIFQRLHGRSAYRGTGVGLAICRKIVERHSGSIAAKSAPGKGATFTVTLPVKQPKGEEPKWIHKDNQSPS